MSRKKIAVILLSLSVLLWAGAISAYKCYRVIKEKKILLEKKSANWLALKEALNLKVMGFKGKSGIVIKDLDTNWELSHNKDRPFPSASLAKIPIMLACFQAAQERKIDLNGALELKGADRVSGSGVLKGMPRGSRFTIKRLIQLMICRSDNTAANMLIDLVGLDYLNSYFKRIGLKDTNLSRRMMDFKRRKNGVENYTTAGDIALALEKLYREKLFSGAVSKECVGLLKQQKIKDRIPARLPDDTVIAHKTGLERRVCHDAGIVFMPSGDLLICVLTKDAENTRAAKRFISGIAHAAYQRYHPRFFNRKIMDDRTRAKRRDY